MTITRTRWIIAIGFIVLALLATRCSDLPAVRDERPTPAPERTRPATAVPTRDGRTPTPPDVPTDEPTATDVPTDEPTLEPTEEPTAEPTEEPTATAEPTAAPPGT